MKSPYAQNNYEKSPVEIVDLAMMMFHSYVIYYMCGIFTYKPANVWGKCWYIFHRAYRLSIGFGIMVLEMDTMMVNNDLTSHIRV